MKKEGNKFKKEFLKTMIQLSTAGFGLAAALAWNETIQSVIKDLIPDGGSGVLSKLIYALIVTFIAVAVTYTLGKMIQAESQDEERQK